MSKICYDFVPMANGEHKEAVIEPKDEIIWQAPFEHEIVQIDPHAVIDKMRDPEGIVTDEFRSLVISLYERIHRRRAQMGIQPYTPTEAAIFMNVHRRTAVLHKDHKREEGTNFWKDHLIGTGVNLVEDQSITGVAAQTAAAVHDDQEDFPEAFKKGRSLLGLREYEDQLPRALPKRLRNITQQVAVLAKGVTKKPEIAAVASRRERDALGLLTLLETCAEAGPRVLCIKQADRTHNASTLQHHPRIKEIAQETADIYIPLANRIMGQQQVTRRLVAHCVHWLNPYLEKIFQQTVQRHHAETIDKCREKLFEQFDPRKNRGSRDFRKFLRERVAEVRIAPVWLADCLTDKAPLEDSRLKDLNITFDNPFYVLEVLLHSRANILLAMDYIQRNTAGSDHVEIERTYRREGPLKLGAVLRVQHPDYGKTLRILINDQESYYRNRRGPLAGFTDENPPDLKENIEAVLRRCRKDPPVIFDLAPKEIFPEQITVKDGKGNEHDLPLDASPMDFSARIHTNLLIGMQTAETSLEGEQRTLTPFDRFKDGEKVFVHSSIPPEKTKGRPRDITADPGWIAVARTEKAKTALRDFFRNPSRYLDFGGPRELEGVASASPRLEEAEESFIVSMAEKYIAKLSALFGIEREEIIKIAKQYDTKHMQETDESIVYHIGRDSIDPLHCIAKHMEGEKEEAPHFVIKVDIKNRPGSLHKFEQELSSYQFNIDAETVPHAKNGIQHAEYEVHDFTGGKTTHECLKIFLKLGYIYPTLQVSASSLRSRITGRVRDIAAKL